MKKTLAFLTLAVFIAVGGGCTSSDAPADETTDTTTDSTTEEVVEETPSEPIAFSEVNQNILDAKETYGEFLFDQGVGTCVDEQGFADSFSYLEDEELGYFVLHTTDGEFVQNTVMATFVNYLEFDEVPLTDGEATCGFKIEFGTDEGTMTCTIDEEEVCTATYQGIAIPR